MRNIVLPCSKVLKRGTYGKQAFVTRFNLENELLAHEEIHLFQKLLCDSGWGVEKHTHTHIHKSIKSTMNEANRQYVLTVCSEGQEKGFLLGIAASQGFKGHSGNALPAHTCVDLYTKLIIFILSFLKGYIMSGKIITSVRARFLFSYISFG